MMKGSEERALAEAINAARTIQDFLWGEANGEWGIEEWRRMFRKRVAKLDAVREDNPHALVELKKRALQQAALSIAFLALLEAGLLSWGDCDVPSNLPEYAEQVIDKISSRKGPKDFPALKTHCYVCGEIQHDTPSGPCCKQGHGGAPAEEDYEECPNCKNGFTGNTCCRKCDGTNRVRKNEE